MPSQELFAPGFGAWIKIGVVYQRTSRHLGELLRPLGVTVAQFDALANLYVGDGKSQQELARQLLVTKANVTGLLDRLQALGHVRRESDPDDGRANRIYLTAVGRRLARRALEVQRKLVDSMMRTLTRREQEALRAVLERLLGRLDGAAAPANGARGRSG
jgi:DNA-binding MarR family transcriptional regulator